MKSGIYVIENKANGKKYVGQSINVKSRMSVHKSHLKRNKHTNEYLQHQYNKYSIENFKFTILEFCEVDILDERERFFISEFKTNLRSKGFNLDDGGTTGRIVNDETRAKFSGENNPMYGRKHSEEFVEHMRICNRGSSDVLTEHDVKDIKNSLLEGLTQSELAEKFNVKRSTINKIVKCKNWEWVCSELNEKLVLLEFEKTKKRNEKILELSGELIYPSEIANKLGLGNRTVENFLGTTNKEVRERRNKMIVEDFTKGLGKKEILDKYSISRKVFSGLTFKFTKQKNKSLTYEAIQMRSHGMTVKAISEELHLHRTTVTEWTKHLLNRPC